MVGPPLGGFITTYFHWRWIFWINAPIGLLGVALALKFIENIRERDVAPFDFKGFVLSGAGLLSLIFGLTVIGRGLAPAPVVVAMVVGGAALLALYVRHARGNPDAILDLGLLKTQTFFDRGRRRLSVSARHRRDSVPAAAVAASRFRPVAVRIGLAHLRRRGRRDGDEIHGLDDPATLGLPPRVDLQWRALRALSSPPTG